MFCVECGASNPDSAKFCHVCGKPLTVSPRAESDVVIRQFPITAAGSPAGAVGEWAAQKEKVTEGAELTKHRFGPKHFVIGLAIIRAITVYAIINKSPDDTNDGSTAVIGEQYQAFSKLPRGSLDSPQSGSYADVRYFDSEQVIDEAEDTASKNDEIGFGQATVGHTHYIPSGTTVLLLDHSVLHNWYEFRVLTSGPHYGEAGYIFEKWITLKATK